MEKQLIAHCAPTLAGLKTANLFGYRFASKDILADEIKGINRIMNPKGVFADILRVNHRSNNAQIFVYRQSRLAADLSRNRAREYLSTRGYKTCCVAACLSRLKERFVSYREFPHEVGFFLGYPPNDVICFIKDGGKNSKRAGFWKVYHDERGAEKKFAQYQKCRNIYMELFSKGKPIERLTVSFTRKERVEWER